MDAPTLMHKLMEMDRALERENEELSLENAGLRQHLDAARHSTLPYSAHARAEMPGDPSPAAQAFRRQLLSTDPVTEGEPANGDPPRTHLWRTTHFFFS
jgi:hypothetical protein